MGQNVELKGITYFPMQARYQSGFISDYSIEVSMDGITWSEVARGEFSNIKASPIEQFVRFEKINARFVRLKSIKTTDGNKATVGEFGILTR